MNLTKTSIPVLFVDGPLHGDVRQLSLMEAHGYKVITPDHTPLTITMEAEDRRMETQMRAWNTFEYRIQELFMFNRTLSVMLPIYAEVEDKRVIEKIMDLILSDKARSVSELIPENPYDKFN